MYSCESLMLMADLEFGKNVLSKKCGDVHEQYELERKQPLSATCVRSKLIWCSYGSFIGYFFFDRKK